MRFGLNLLLWTDTLVDPMLPLLDELRGDRLTTRSKSPVLTWKILRITRSGANGSTNWGWPGSVRRFAARRTTR